MNLIEQPTRHLTQRSCLTGQNVDGLGGLRADLFGGLLHHLRVVRQDLVELHGLRGEDLTNHPRMLAEHLVRLGRILTKSSLDDFQPFRESIDYVLSAFVHHRVERLCLLGDR